MSKSFGALVAVAMLAGAAGPVAAQQTFARSGTLTCNVSPGVGFVVGSRQALGCRFQPDRGPPQNYEGTTTTVGVDVGITGGGVLVWAVLMSTTDPYPGALAGTYVGASGEASIGVGVGANVLVGGSNQTVALQPLSLQGQVGLNLAVGVTGIELHYVR